MPTPTRTETILVVDDEVMIRSLTHSMLTRYGYNVIVADSAKAALELLTWPDMEVSLAVIDIIMPEMNGVELAARIADMRPELPILFCTGYSEREELRPFLDRNFPYVTKPFTSVTLTRRIRELLDKPKADAAPSHG